MADGDSVYVYIRPLYEASESELHKLTVTLAPILLGYDLADEIRCM